VTDLLSAPGVAPTAQARSRILVVDDEESLRRSIARILERHGHICSMAADAQESVELLARNQYHLVLADMKMPGHTGMWLADLIFSEYPDTAVIMVTGVDDTRVAERALERGAYGYVIKPFEPNEIVIGVANALRRRALEIENRRHRESLELLVAERTATLEATVADLAEAAKALRSSQEETVRRLAIAAEFHDPVTGVHLQRISRLSGDLARAMRLSPARCDLIRFASPMHDVGKIGISGSVLRKPDRLAPDEIKEMERHPEIGYALLADSKSEILQLGATIALSHHERFDGTGYPRGLAGKTIPLEGRIVAVADVFDALISERPYKRAFGFDEALTMVIDERGRHFDPDVVDAFRSIADEIYEFVAAATPSSPL
jgi:putative two-component system response regulator